MSGKFRSSLIIGGQGIRARKLRTLLSMVSLFLGVLAVIAVQAGGQVAEKAMLADIELQRGIDGTESLYLPQHEKTSQIVQETLQGKKGVSAFGSTQITIGEPNTTPLNPGGSSFDPRYSSFGGSGRYTTVCDASGMCYGKPVDEKQPPKGAAIELRTTTMIGDIRQFRPFRLVSGQWLDFDSAPSMSPQIVLNTAAAEGFKNNKIPAELHVQGGTKNATPRIVGVVDDGQGAYSATAYVRADELQNWAPAEAKPPAAAGAGKGAPANFGRSSGSGGLSSVFLAPGSEGIKQTLKARLAAAGAEVDGMSSQRTNPKKQMESMLNLMKIIFLAMASLVLLIGVAGILNVGLATVGERVEEFALRRAVGTSRMLLTFIVLSETLLTGLLTALAAIGAGVIGFEVAAMMLSGKLPALADMSFPWEAGMAGVIAGLVAGLLGGLIPAIRAARIPISTVMRA
ncbi:ABC transporter permease [Allokutzneria sp. A3M-2-11 16]|uniref:ABC transporter permease n=1 Tax=Allokutzneria sp. A3M-2-11 16 TaxID=2962043 RepID=UPI0020B84B29|nr:ABC transporter permease [Allokutzneria sp. A3M-2-11 16]MCP3800588.1 ABC transporter permease [Allokutzneria sp. A3M-2-11 16]